MGQFALYTGGILGKSLRSMWVEKVEGRKITLEFQILHPDRTAAGAPMPQVIDLDNPEPVPWCEVTELGTEEVEVAGRRLACRKSEAKSPGTLMGDITTQSWTCDQVPLWGTVRSVTKGSGSDFTEELLDFGDEGGAARPVKPKR